MLTYLALAFFLWAISFATMIERRERTSLSFISLAVFIVFAGFRFETGNDWVIYRDAYDSLPNFLFESINTIDWFQFEPLYVVLSFLLKPILDFQFFQLAVVTFNALVLFWFCRKNETPFSGIFALYFCWIYLATQMATIRYSIAISFLLFALNFGLRKRFFFSMFFAVIAVGFHYSAALFIPIVYFSQRKFDFKAVFFLITLLMALAVGIKFELADYLLNLGASEKINLYVLMSNYSTISAGSVIFIFINLGMIYFFSTKKFAATFSPERARLLILSTIYLLIFQIFLWFIPVFWGRVMILVITLQFLGCFNYFKKHQSYAFFGLTALISMVVLYRQISDPAAISYVPYQNYIIDKVFQEDISDGEDRFYEALYIHMDRNVN